MEKVKLLKKGGINTQAIIDELKSDPDVFDACGAIVLFIGIVRGTGHDGKKGKRTIL
ncbi:MAG: hypothetical protein ABIH76_01595 [Candidatus Bathyarchaeota archaeon]